MKSFKGTRRMWARVVREGHLEEGTFKGSLKNEVALARARQMKEGSSGSSASGYEL